MKRYISCVFYTKVCNRSCQWQVLCMPKHARKADGCKCVCKELNIWVDIMLKGAKCHMNDIRMCYLLNNKNREVVKENSEGGSV